MLDIMGPKTYKGRSVNGAKGARVKKRKKKMTKFGRPSLGLVKRMKVQLTAENYRRVQTLAKAEGISAAEWVRRVLGRI